MIFNAILQNMIRSASIRDINAIMQITKDCARDLRSKGIYQWNQHYPSEEAFKADVVRGELYILDKSNGVIGCVCISEIMDDEYQEINWLTPSTNNIYIHRLAIHSRHQGQGHARELMDFAENKARKANCASVRLDTFSKNLRNQKFYELRDYKKLGNIYFPKQSKHPFYCYELIL